MENLRKKQARQEEGLVMRSLVSTLTLKVKVAQSCQTLCDPMDYTVHGILQARIVGCFPFSRGSFNPREQTQVSRLAGGFFTSWVTREPKNTGVGNLSLLHWIFPTQESNWGPCMAGIFFTSWAIREAPPSDPLFYTLFSLPAAPFLPLISLSLQ